MSAPDGYEQLRHIRDQAEDVPPWEPNEPPPDDAPGGVPPEPARDLFLPDGCPVIPLGVSGEMYFYLDQLGQLRALKAKDHSRLNVQSLFGRLSELLYDFWPRKTQQGADWVTTGWKPELAAESLMAAAAAKGAWSPVDKVRGAGAWPGPDGELILHVGDRLLIVPAERADSAAGRRVPWTDVPPGVVGGYVYPTAPPTLRPALDAAPPGPDGPAAKMLELFSTWNVRRKEIDPTLMLGWTGAGMLGGAIPWRVLMWTTGGFGTGKSTLQDVLKWTMGENGILQTSDYTAAAVRQLVRHSSLPVALDEAEAEEDNRKMNQLIKLARDAATGALAVRGGSDHEAATFTLRSGFLFSSILIPPLLPQDRSRIAVIDLLKLPKDAPKPKVTPKRMAELGAQLLRRLVDNWHRWPATLEAYRNAMGEVGHSARGQDVFGTMLAAADLLLYDEPPDSDSLVAWQEKMPATAIAETEGAGDDADACLTYLLTTSIEAPRDRQRGPIGWWQLRAQGVNPEDGQAVTDDEKRHANRVLSTYGVKVHEYDLDDGLGPRPWLAVANMHTGLAKLFEGTQWGARPGADGVWKQSLGRLVKDQRQLNVQVWFGKNIRSTLLQLDLCSPAGESPPDDDSSAAGRSPGTSGAGTGTTSTASGRSAADPAFPYDQSAAGGPPRPGGADKETTWGAGGRSAADTAFLTPVAPGPDPRPDTL